MNSRNLISTLAISSFGSCKCSSTGKDSLMVTSQRPNTVNMYWILSISFRLRNTLPNCLTLIRTCSLEFCPGCSKVNLGNTFAHSQNVSAFCLQPCFCHCLRQKDTNKSNRKTNPKFWTVSMFLCFKFVWLKAKKKRKSKQKRHK